MLRIFALCLGGMLVALELMLAPHFLGASLLILAVVFWRQRSRPWQAPARIEFWTRIWVGGVVWAAVAALIVFVDLAVNFDVHATLTAPRIVPWTTIPSIFDEPLPALWLTIHGIVGTLGLVLLQHAAPSWLSERIWPRTFPIMSAGPSVQLVAPITPLRRASKSSDTLKSTDVLVLPLPPLNSEAAPHPVRNRNCVPGRSPGMRWLIYTTFWAGAAGLCWGIGLQSPMLVWLATFFVAGGLALVDISDSRRGGLTCITVYSIMSAAPALANVIGTLARGSANHDLYYFFTSDEHVYLASLIGLGSAVVPVLGFWALWRSRGIKSWTRLLPRVTAHMSDRALIVSCVALSAISIGAQAVGDFKFSSTLISVLTLVPCMSAFLLARAASARRVRGALIAGLVIVLAESARAFFLSYLRSPIAYPYFAFACGAWLGSRSLRPLFRPHYFVVYAAALWYIANYGIIGEIREDAPYGVARLAYLEDHKAQMRENDSKAKQTFVSRLTTFNQLSQIGKIVEEDGFYNGTTLSYFNFAFVPRFIWPEKPYIQRGSWFAVRIGQARATPDGWYNNTVNMTQAGELYLNFGILGLVVGLLAYGVFIGVLWISANFSDARNALGGAFAYFLVWSMLGQHGDLTIIVTGVAMYLLFVGASLAIREVRKVRAWMPSAVAVPIFIGPASNSEDDLLQLTRRRATNVASDRIVLETGTGD